MSSFYTSHDTADIWDHTRLEISKTNRLATMTTYLCGFAVGREGRIVSDEPLGKVDQPYSLLRRQWIPNLLDEGCKTETLHKLISKPQRDSKHGKLSQARSDELIGIPRSLIHNNCYRLLAKLVAKHRS